MLKAIRSGEIKIGNVVLKCHVLEDGERVIEPEGLAALFEEGAIFNSEEVAVGFKELQQL